MKNSLKSIYISQDVFYLISSLRFEYGSFLSRIDVKLDKEKDFLVQIDTIFKT